MSNPIQLPLKVIAQTAQRRGFDTGKWSPQDPSLAVVASHAEVHKLVNYLQEQDPDMPLAVTIGKYSPPFDFGLPSRIARHCPTLRESVERYIYFQTLAAPKCTCLEPHEKISDTEVLVAPSPPMDPSLAASRAFRCIYPMAFAIANLRRLADEPSLQAKAVDVMADDDGRNEEYEEFFGAPLNFGADKNRVHFDSEILDLPVKGADPEVIPYLEKLALKEFEQFGHRPGIEENFDALVRTKLEEAILDGNFELADLAQSLTMSERTLQRRLKEEGLSYRSLVDEVRMELALELFRAPEHSLQQISHKLGYKHLASFTRAFKRWTGRSPGEFREVLGQEA